MDAPEHADAHQAEDAGPAAGMPPGQASAFRRALDAQAQGDDPGSTLVPSGPHDLTAPLDREEIARALSGSPTARPGAVPGAEAQTADPQSPAAIADSRNRVPVWAPPVHMVKPSSQTATTYDASGIESASARAADTAVGPPATTQPDSAAPSSGKGRRRGPERLYLVSSVCVLLAALAGIILVASSGGNGNKSASPLALPSASVPLQSPPGSPPASVLKTSAAPTPATATATATATTTTTTATAQVRGTPASPPASLHAPAPSVTASGPRVDLALGRPSTASSYTQTYVPANAVDGSSSTYWESADNAFPQWLQVDLGLTATAATVVLDLPPSQAWNTRTQTISFQGSTDGWRFTTVLAQANYTFDPSTGNTVTVALPAQTSTRYLRLTFTANTGWPAGQLSRLQVFS